MDALLIPWDEYDSSTAAPAEGGGIVHKRKHLILDGSSDASSSLSTLIPIKDISFISIIGGGGKTPTRLFPFSPKFNNPFPTILLFH
jgi:hypothetical protein